MMRAIYVQNLNRQCEKCHTNLTWRCGFVGKMPHPIVCFSCVWSQKPPAGWMRIYLDAVEEAVRQRHVARVLGERHEPE